MSEEGSGDLQSRIGLTARSRRRRHVWRWFTVLLVGIAVVVGVMRLRASRPEPGAQYQMETVERGTLTVTVTATGELKSAHAGQHRHRDLGHRRIGERRLQQPGRPSARSLAKVNTEKIEAQAAQARAALRSAEAKQLQSEATFKPKREAELARLQHVRELSGGRVPSKQEIDSQEATVKRAAPIRRVPRHRCTVTGQPDRHRNRHQESDHPLADQRHRARSSSRSGSDRGGLVSNANAVHACPGPDQDEADCRRRRSRHRQRPRRPDRKLSCRCVPGSMFSSKVNEVRSTPKTSNGVVTYQTVLASTTPSACSNRV